MAIPCYLPRVEDSEENYRRLERLLYELYQVLRLLLGPPPPPSVHSGSPHGGNGPPPPSGPSGGAGGAGGGSGPSGGSGPAVAARLGRSAGRTRRGGGSRNHTPAEGTPVAAPATPPPPHNVCCEQLGPVAYWAKLGSELRTIADTFQANHHQYQSRPHVAVKCSARSGKLTKLQLAAAAFSLFSPRWGEAD